MRGAGGRFLMFGDSEAALLYILVFQDTAIFATHFALFVLIEAVDGDGHYIHYTTFVIRDRHNATAG